LGFFALRSSQRPALTKDYNMNFRRALLALGIAGLMVFALSGCFVITADSPSQLNTIGDVVVHTEACISSATSTDSCSNTGNSVSAINDTAGPYDAQFFLAYRIPDGYGAPTQVTSTSGSPQMVLNASTDYASQLTTLAPPPAGEHWVGYMTDGLTTPALNTQYVFNTHFTRPPAQNGVPASVPFQYLTVTGGREVNSTVDTLHADRPLNCGTTFQDLTGNFNTESGTGGAADFTSCIDSPAVSTTATSLPADTVLFTRDLAVAPGSATANRNSTVNVPFTMNFVGPADPSAVFTLASSIAGLSGASATPASSTFTPPANSSTVQNVAVHLPANAKAGTYQVPFSATLANGQTRTATGTVTVLPDTTGPKLKISFPKLRLAKGSKGFKITVSCSEDCSLLATLSATPKALKAAKLVKLGSAKAKLPAAGKKTLTIKLTHSGKSKLKALAKNHKSLKGTLTIVATDGLGNKTKASKHVTLK
jgi:hypothetical protein